MSIYPRPKNITDVYNDSDYLSTETELENYFNHNHSNNENSNINTDEFVKKSGSTMSGSLKLPKLIYSIDDSEQTTAFTDTIKNDIENNKTKLSKISYSNNNTTIQNDLTLTNLKFGNSNNLQTQAFMDLDKNKIYINEGNIISNSNSISNLQSKTEYITSTTTHTTINNDLKVNNDIVFTNNTVNYGKIGKDDSSNTLVIETANNNNLFVNAGTGYARFWCPTLWIGNATSGQIYMNNEYQNSAFTETIKNQITTNTNNITNIENNLLTHQDNFSDVGNDIIALQNKTEYITATANHTTINNDVKINNDMIFTNNTTNYGKIGKTDNNSNDFIIETGDNNNLFINSNSGYTQFYTRNILMNGNASGNCSLYLNNEVQQSAFTEDLKSQIYALSQSIVDMTTIINNIQVIPTGSIQMFGGSYANCPSGWLPCAGSQVLKSTYQTLYNVIGDAFGQDAPASNSDYFYLPDFSQAYPCGSGTSYNYSHLFTAQITSKQLGKFYDQSLQAHSHNYLALLTT